MRITYIIRGFAVACIFALCGCRHIDKGFNQTSINTHYSVIAKTSSPKGDSVYIIINTTETSEKAIEKAVLNIRTEICQAKKCFIFAYDDMKYYKLDSSYKAELRQLAYNLRYMEITSEGADRMFSDIDERYFSSIKDHFVGYLDTSGIFNFYPYKNITFHHPGKHLLQGITYLNNTAACNFKMISANNKWSRANEFRIDIMSETFACGLKDKRIDTVMLCKYIFNNGSLAREKAFVLWQDKGKGFVKVYFNYEERKPKENPVAGFEWKGLLQYFFEERLDTVKTEPHSKYYIENSMGYSVQLQIPGLFYRGNLPDYFLLTPQSDPKTIWWTMISKQLESLQSSKTNNQ